MHLKNQLRQALINRHCPNPDLYLAIYDDARNAIGFDKSHQENIKESIKKAEKRLSTANRLGYYHISSYSQWIDSKKEELYKKRDFWITLLLSASPYSLHRISSLLSHELGLIDAYISLEQWMVFEYLEYQDRLLENLI